MELRRANSCREITWHGFERVQPPNFFSEVLITGFMRAAGAVVPAQPERPLPNGSKLA